MSRVVVKISGTPVERPEAYCALWSALAGCVAEHHVAVVHGGGRSVDARLASLGFGTAKIEGVRVTPDEQMGVIAGVLAGEVNRALVGALAGAGANAAGVGLCDGGLCVCEPVDPDALGRVGRVTDASGGVAWALLDAGVLPVVHSIGLDAEGGLLNVNADEAAAGVARAIEADRLVLLTDVPGVLDADGALIEQIDEAKAEALIASRVIEGGMCVKVRSALSASAAAGCEVVIGSWDRAAELVSVEPGEIAGTRVIAGAAAGTNRERSE